jgi:threonine dehydratase
MDNSNKPPVSDFVTYAMVLAAYEKCRPYVLRTPLLRAEKLERLFDGAHIYLKLESLQRAGSFKMRGVVNKMLSL